MAARGAKVLSDLVHLYPLFRNQRFSFVINTLSAFNNNNDNNNNNSTDSYALYIMKAY